jgi:hypothetical protein
MQNEAEASVAFFSNNIVAEKWDELLQNLPGDFVCDPDGTVSEEDARLIFRTIYGHSAAAAGRYRLMKDKYWSERTEKIIFQIKYMQKAEGRKLVLFPYGRTGKNMRNFLHDHDIYEDIIADNRAEGAVLMSYFEGKNTDNYILLLCTEKLIHYEELKKEAYKYFKKENVVELVSEEDFIKGFL